MREGGRKEVVRMLYFTGTESAAQFISETSVCYEPPNDLCRHFLCDPQVQYGKTVDSSSQLCYTVRTEPVSSLICNNYIIYTHLSVMFISHNLILIMML